jgi:hypothetical protein
MSLQKRHSDGEKDIIRPYLCCQSQPIPATNADQELAGIAGGVTDTKGVTTNTK